MHRGKSTPRQIYTAANLHRGKSTPRQRRSLEASPTNQLDKFELL
jgi:hypothetical protein